MKTALINESETLDQNESWLNPPSTLTSEDFDQTYAGMDPEYYEN